jgi:hypothetical protein
MKRLTFSFIFILILANPNFLLAENIHEEESDKKSTLMDGLNKENFSKENIKNWFAENFSKSEEFRRLHQEKIIESKDKVSENRKKETDASGATKLVIFFHFAILFLVAFILSNLFLFYAVCLLITYKILRILWKIIRGVFRKKEE